ncbi:hypothetical protein SDC9_190691 [bioreactor metagenome]|uniref:Uncharacterized protein n=1 Tax=bioreactor metagenome TaxID=1076179 RepID=A0A645HXA9_9ZZZZ
MHNRVADNADARNLLWRSPRFGCSGCNQLVQRTDHNIAQRMRVFASEYIIGSRDDIRAKCGLRVLHADRGDLPARFAVEQIADDAGRTKVDCREACSGDLRVLRLIRRKWNIALRPVL